MNIEEAARQSIRQEIIDTGCDVWEVFGQEIERAILRAFKIAGYGWRPIEKAKKDGTMYLLSNGADVSVGWWGANLREGGLWCSNESDGYMWSQPTHFHKLPPPPTPKKQETPNE